MTTVRLGVIGAGLMGREIASAAARWLHLLDLDFRPKIVAVSDIDPERLGWFEGRVVPASGLHPDYADLLARTDVDAVYCAVPHNLHETVYRDVLQAGKHLLGEKPFGIDEAANEQIVSEALTRPELLVRCSSEFPFWPAGRLIEEAVSSGRLGRLIEVRAAFMHSSDLDPGKPINWKRLVDVNGEYGVLGDLGMHVLHLPLRLGLQPSRIFALLSNIVTERPDSDGRLVPCETWDNAILACEGPESLPMLLEVKRIAPGELNTWSLEILGDRGGVRFSTKQPKTFWSFAYVPGEEQSWASTDLGSRAAYKTITGEIFEFGFSDSILQMLAAFCDEVVNGADMVGPFACATLEETSRQHAVLTAALESQRRGQVVTVDYGALAIHG